MQLQLAVAAVDHTSEVRSLAVQKKDFKALSGVEVHHKNLTTAQCYPRVAKGFEIS